MPGTSQVNGMRFIGDSDLNSPRPIGSGDPRSDTSFGLDTDLIAPGDYDGDGMNDYTVVRNESGQLVWYSLLSSGGFTFTPWGLSTDFLTPGDYDGDGKTDPSVWRPSEGNFYSFKSSDGTFEGLHWGLTNDYPAANAQVH